MVEFLIALIEWFAVIALSSVGVETTQASQCGSAPAPQPAEYREAIFMASDTEMNAGWTTIRTDDCNQWVTVSDPRETPEFLSPPLVYTS